MVRFKLYAAMNLKSLVQPICKLFPKAFIAFSEHEVRISASDEDVEIDAMLIINAQGFFDEYHCSYSRAFEVDPKEFRRILCLAESDDQIIVALNNKSAVPVLEFRISDSRANLRQVVKLEVLESLIYKWETKKVVDCRTQTHQPFNNVRQVVNLDALESLVGKWEDEEVVQRNKVRRVVKLEDPKNNLSTANVVQEVTGYQWEASINPKYFKQVVHRTTQTHPLLTVTIMKNGTVTLSSGGDIVRVTEQEGNSENCVVDLSLYRHMGAFKVASELVQIVAGTVRLKFAAEPPSPHILLEFPVSQFSNISFYFPQHSYKNLVMIKVLTAGTIMEMLKSIPNIASTTIVQFSPSQVSFYVQDETHYKEALVQLNADLFTEFQCSRLLSVRADLVKLTSVVNCLEVDDRVCICVKDEEPITCIGFHIRNSNTKKNVINEVDCSEVMPINLGHQKCLIATETKKYEVDMNTEKFGESVAFSETSKEHKRIRLADRMQ